MDRTRIVYGCTVVCALLVMLALLPGGCPTSTTSNLSGNNTHRTGTSNDATNSDDSGDETVTEGTTATGGSSGSHNSSGSGGTATDDDDSDDDTDTGTDLDDDDTGTDDDDADGKLDVLDLDIVKLTHPATTQRGPAAGDGVFAFDADLGANLAFVRAGEKEATIAEPPADMMHDRDAFSFCGKTIVTRDRFSGSLFVYDTVTEQVRAIPAESIDVGGSDGPNYWETDGDYIAVANWVFTTADGPGKIIKLVDVSDIDDLKITPFEHSPDYVDWIDLDAEAGRILVRGGDTFYVYDMDHPESEPDTYTDPSFESASANASAQIAGDLVAFFDSHSNFTLVNLADETTGSPGRNPGRPSCGVAFDGGRWCYFATETDEDGTTISNTNRAIVGYETCLDELVDPAGDYVDGSSATYGQVGFGLRACVSPDGWYAFVAGDSGVGVQDYERLYVSVDGCEFQAVADSEDPYGVVRAANPAVSNNIVAFIIPYGDATTDVSVGYAVLEGD